jgi:hypothetical protein
MQQISSWEAISHSPNQEILCLLWNPKVQLPGSQEPTCKNAVANLLEKICDSILSLIGNYL